MPAGPQSRRQFTTQRRVLLDKVGDGKAARALRRAFLFERGTGRMLELQTAFLDLEFGLEALNTQAAVLGDLAFLHEWCELRRSQASAWVAPEHRAAEDMQPLTEPEVRDFARWCQLKASVLAMYAQLADRKLSRLPLGDVVGPQLRNRRLRSASAYLQWLTISLATTKQEGSEVPGAELRRRRTERLFAKQLISVPKLAPDRALTPTQARDLRVVLRDGDVFPHTDIGTRDRLIFELLLQGLRAGELLKLQVRDLIDGYEVAIGRRIAVLCVTRRPNDADDGRRHEPAVKTRPGDLPIPRRVAFELVSYIKTFRRPAVDARGGGVETPYLLVNHSGPHIGCPLSQRNLNRIVAKLKGRLHLPASFGPHALRHTHFTELYDRHFENGRSDHEIRALLLQRGRWAPNSKMPARYTTRSLMRLSAEYVEERDRELDSG